MERSAILYRTYERALAARKALARSGAPTLGADLTTPEAYLAESWALWGDGRRIVGPRERLLLVADGLRRPGGPLQPTLGTAQAIARFVSRHGGAEALGRAIAGRWDGEPFTASERAALDAMGEHLRALGERGLVEGQQAAELLVEAMPAAPVRAAEALFVAPGSQRWLEALAGAPLPQGPFALPPLPAGVQPRFAFPAGQTAVARALHDEVLGALAAAEAEGAAAAGCGEGELPRIVLCAPDAPALFEALAPSLVAEGAACSLQASMPFGQTALGRALGAVRALGEGVPSWREAATDFAYGPLAGLPPYEAERLNGLWRGDRLSTAAAAREQLREVSPTFPLFEALVREESPEALDALATAAAERSPVPAHLAAQERAALQALERLLADAAALEVPALAGELAATLAVPLSVAVGPEGARPPRANVAFCSLQAMDGLAPASAYEVIVVDLTDRSFDGAAACSPLDELAAKLGLAQAPARFDQWRCAFACAEAAATARFACVAPLRGADQGEAYPAFLFDEFVATLGDGAELDEGLFAVPAPLAMAAARPGEEDLVAGLGQAFVEPEGWVELPAPERGRLRALPMAAFMASVQEGERKLPVLSPSAIEAYLQCPYKWFVERKVRPRSLDEGFTSLEQGTFAHAVLRELFERLAAEGVRSLGDATLPRALEVLDQAFDDLEAAQVDLAPGERLVAASPSEALEVAALRPRLRESVAAMAALPPSFAVWAHERAIAPGDGVDYAGARLTGRVDRIDVDAEAGRFVVLDYKGSLAKHEAGLGAEDSLEELTLPPKVQALVYAKALEGMLEGLACVGALYLSYQAKDAARLAAGSFSALGYDAAACATKGSLVEGSFDAFLAAVERAIEPQVAAMVRGDIAPDPADGACQWCLVPFCERRR